MKEPELIHGKYLLGQASSPADTRRIYEDRAMVTRVDTARGMSLIVGMVADGVGSTQGSVAAQKAVDVVLRTITDSQLDNIPAIIEAAMKAANLAVYEDNERSGSDNYTTLVLGIISNNRLFVGNAGDSRIYWIQQSGHLVQLTLDHNYYNIFGGDPNSEEAERVVNYIGKKSGLEVDLGLYLEKDDPAQAYKLGLKGLPLKDGDAIMLCSDGLIKKSPFGERYATDRELVEAVQTEIMPDAAATKLVGITIGRKVDDNVSVVTIQSLTPAIIAQVKGKSQRARYIRWGIYGGIGAGLLGLLITAIVLYSGWRKTSGMLTVIQNQPTATSVVILITNTPLPSATPTMVLDPGKAQVASLQGQVTYNLGDGPRSMVDHQELETQTEILTAPDGGVYIEFGDPEGTRSYAYLFNDSTMKFNFATSLTPDLIHGKLYIRAGSGYAKVYFPNLGSLNAYFDNSDRPTPNNRMLVEVVGSSIWIWCLNGNCILSKGSVPIVSISANAKRLYDNETATYGPEIPITYDELWALHIACAYTCLAEFVPTPTPTPSLTPTITLPLPSATGTRKGDQPIPTATPTPTYTPTFTLVPTETLKPTDTPKPSLTSTPTHTNTPIPTTTSTPLPTATPTATYTPIPTQPLPECSDGADNDNDGAIDFNADPGCKNSADTDEHQECNDGKDNDGDILIDYPLDDGCTDILDDSEEKNNPLLLITEDFASSLKFVSFPRGIKPMRTP